MIKKIIVWAIFSIAVIFGIVEAFYGHPSRLIFYVFLFIFGWIVNWFMERNEKKPENTKDKDGQ